MRDYFLMGLLIGCVLLAVKVGPNLVGWINRHLEAAPVCVCPPAVTP